MTFLITLSTLSHGSTNSKYGLKTAKPASNSKFRASQDELAPYSPDLIELEENGTVQNLGYGFIMYTLNPYFGIDSLVKMASENLATENRGTTDNTKDRNGNHGRNSKRLYIHKPDDKIIISGYQRRQFPYSNVVRLSSGCTGTLLTPFHVLSAAHCVHDGKDFKPNIEMLKIEVPDKIGYRLHYVQTIKISVKWIKSQKLPEAAKGAYDYAILELNLPVRRRARFMQLAVPDINELGSVLHFFGFFSTETSGMWKSTCSTDDGVVLMQNNVVLAECDSATGNSGAAVFTENARDGQRIIGVLSNTIADEEEVEFSSIMLLTLSKALDICAMIYPSADEYDICSIVRRQNIERLAGPKRIVPFFGK